MKHFYLFLILIMTISCAEEKISPVGPLPSKRQLAWHELEYYGFLHFNMNTFTNVEWGEGSENPKVFNPSELNAMQWAKIAKEAGMKGLIITAKHHDGFCLWPSEYTEHSVKNSLWKDGKGDVIKELAEACKAYGLKMGVYLSPWDRNHPDYGTPEYVTVFHNQLRELLTNYGEIFEVWFDGANGGSGYYGGANETRKIDNKTYYEWDKVEAIVRELQPNAVIFGDGGPGVRWVGNEEGWANKTNWSLLRKGEVYPGYDKYKELRSGHENGTHWVPAEADVSIRPGWYYHPYEDHKVKTLPHLLDIYYQSVGRNASLLLNLPIDKRGIVHEKDQEQLMKLKNQLDKDFKDNLALQAEVFASNVRSSNFSAEKVKDEDKETYWTTTDDEKKSNITFDFGKPIVFNRLLLQEYIALGQRVASFLVEVEVNGVWQELTKQTTIGYKRILRFDAINASKIRITITKAKGNALLSNIEIYNAPKTLVSPVFKRSKLGMTSLLEVEKGVEVYYTLDGTIPDNTSIKYKHPFLVEQPTTIKAIAYDPVLVKSSDLYTQDFDICKAKWQVVSVETQEQDRANKIIDDDVHTSWSTSIKGNTPSFVTIDLGEKHLLKGITYLPMQDRWIKGVITHFEISISENREKWTKVADGEFGNVWNNPVLQKVNFKSITARYVKIVAKEIHGTDINAAFGEFGVITR